MVILRTECSTNFRTKRQGTPFLRKLIPLESGVEEGCSPQPSFFIFRRGVFKPIVQRDFFKTEERCFSKILFRWSPALKKVAPATLHFLKLLWKAMIVARPRQSMRKRCVLPRHPPQGVKPTRRSQVSPTVVFCGKNYRATFMRR